MSTKASVTIKSHDNAIHAFRPCDGDPEWTGRDIGLALQSGDFFPMVAELLRERRIYQSYYYAPSEGFAGQYCYTIDFTDHLNPKWTAAQAPLPRVTVESRTGDDAWGVIFDGEYAAYRRFINATMTDGERPRLEADERETSRDYALYRARLVAREMGADPDTIEIERFWTTPEGDIVSVDDAAPGEIDTTSIAEFSTIFLHSPQGGRHEVIDTDAHEDAEALASTIEQHVVSDAAPRPA